MTNKRLLELFDEVKCDKTIYCADDFTHYKHNMSGDTTKLIEPKTLDENKFWEAYDNYNIALVKVGRTLYFEVLLLNGDGVEKIDEDFKEFALFNNNGARND